MQSSCWSCQWIQTFITTEFMYSFIWQKGHESNRAIGFFVFIKADRGQKKKKIKSDLPWKPILELSLLYLKMKFNRSKIIQYAGLSVRISGFKAKTVPAPSPWLSVHVNIRTSLSPTLDLAKFKQSHFTANETKPRSKPEKSLKSPKTLTNPKLKSAGYTTR